MRSASLQRNVQISFLTAVAMALHLVESTLPPLPVPGAKIGLANVATLVALKFVGFWPAVAVAAIRSTLGSALAGKFLGLGFWMSFGGATASALIMGLGLRLTPRNASAVWASLAGATAHASVQMAIAIRVLGQPTLLVSFPLLLGLSLITGVFIGLVCDGLDKPLHRFIVDRDRRNRR
ncbi:MAG: Heptaprenyl diphosphate synthase component I [Firmicutes bacterium ADurb.Bin506]|nr:MAG: Heptaprenyl diphosphate synthase component I [Firmicutes bacterium ADurb.Bin506]